MPRPVKCRFGLISDRSGTLAHPRIGTSSYCSTQPGSIRRRLATQFEQADCFVVEN